VCRRDRAQREYAARDQRGNRVEDARLLLGFDAQTSGGLLIGVSSDRLPFCSNPSHARYQWIRHRSHHRRSDGRIEVTRSPEGGAVLPPEVREQTETENDTMNSKEPNPASAHEVVAPMCSKPAVRGHGDGSAERLRGDDARGPDGWRPRRKNEGVILFSLCCSAGAAVFRRAFAPGARVGITSGNSTRRRGARSRWVARRCGCFIRSASPTAPVGPISFERLSETAAPSLEFPVGRSSKP